jgi:hypothetical protein
MLANKEKSYREKTDKYEKANVFTADGYEEVERSVYEYVWKSEGTIDWREFCEAVKKNNGY